MGLEFKLPEGKTMADFLNEKGWDQKKIREKSKIGTRTYYELRNNKIPGIKGLEELCRMLRMQPGSFLRYVPDDQTKEDREKKDQHIKTDPEKTITDDPESMLLFDYGMSPEIIDYFTKKD